MVSGKPYVDTDRGLLNDGVSAAGFAVWTQDIPLGTWTDHPAQTRGCLQPSNLANSWNWIFTLWDLAGTSTNKAFTSYLSLKN